MKVIIEMALSNGGLITSRQVTEAGIPRSRIFEMVERGELERVERGIYYLSGSWEDEFEVAQLRFPRGVFSDETALFLLDFTDRTPERLTMTFPRSYNATKAREAGIEVRTCANACLSLGVTEVRTPLGNKVKAYDLERTLCDLLRGRKTVDVQVVGPAMRAYVRKHDKNLRKLLGYARLLGVEKKMRSQLEVLL